MLTSHLFLLKVKNDVSEHSPWSMTPPPHPQYISSQGFSPCLFSILIPNLFPAFLISLRFPFFTCPLGALPSLVHRFPKRNVDSFLSKRYCSSFDGCFVNYDAFVLGGGRGRNAISAAYVTHSTCGAFNWEASKTDTYYKADSSWPKDTALIPCYCSFI